MGEAYRNQETTGDCFYQKPDGMDLLVEQSCSFNLDSQAVSNSSEYDRRLSTIAKVDASVPLIGGSFSVSTEYDNFMKRSTVDKMKWVEYHAECQQFRTYLHQEK